MSLVVETGVGVLNAESYVSLVQADAYHSARGNEAWLVQPDEVKEAALRRATDYLTQQYTQQWCGFRATAVQALDWPRQGVRRPGSNGWGYGADLWPYDAVPLPIAAACCELALRTMTGAKLSPDMTPTSVVRKIGPIEFSAAPASAPKFTAIEALLEPFIESSTFMRVSRA